MRIVHEAFYHTQLNLSAGTDGRVHKGSGLYGAQVESNMLNYDLTPAKWASGNSTMRFSVEN